MAEQNDQPGLPPQKDMDYREHEATYALFGVMLKWGSIGVVIILLLMLAFCVPHGK